MTTDSQERQHEYIWSAECTGCGMSKPPHMEGCEDFGLDWPAFTAAPASDDSALRAIKELVANHEESTDTSNTRSPDPYEIFVEIERVVEAALSTRPEREKQDA